MTIKVVQWATGKLGGAMLAEAIRDPRFEVVGCYVYSPDKVGVDIGTLVGLDPIGVKATDQRDEIFALDADIVFHAPLHRFPASMDQHDADVMRLLESGKNVISVMGYTDPAGFGEAHAAPLRDACIRGGSSLFGTGVTPGFISERLAVAVSGLCTDIKSLDVLEHYNISAASPAMLRTMGMGIKPDEFDEEKIGEENEKFYGSFFADVLGRLGGKVDRFERSKCELVLAEGPMQSKGMPFPVDKGDIVGCLWKWTVYTQGKPFFTYRMQWQLGDQIPGWYDWNGWTITIDGTPCVKTDLAVASSMDKFGSGVAEYGEETMAALVINAVHDVIAAPPGFFKAPVFAPYNINAT